MQVFSISEPISHAPESDLYRELAGNIEITKQKRTGFVNLSFSKLYHW